MGTTVLQCECGFQPTAVDEAALVAEVRRHAREAHGMPLSDAEARLIVLQTEAASDRRGVAHHETTHEARERPAGSRDPMEHDEGRST